MDKKKISKKRKKSLKDMSILELKSGIKVKPFKAGIRMRNKDLISQALWDCLLANDVQGFKDILKTHLELVNKENLANQIGIPKRTLFRLLSQEGNPTLKTISKLIYNIYA